MSTSSPASDASQVAAANGGPDAASSPDSGMAGMEMGSTAADDTGAMGLGGPDAVAGASGLPAGTTGSLQADMPQLLQSLEQAVSMLSTVLQELEGQSAMGGSPAQVTQVNLPDQTDLPDQNDVPSKFPTKLPALPLPLVGTAPSGGGASGAPLPGDTPMKEAFSGKFPGKLPEQDGVTWAMVPIRFGTPIAYESYAAQTDPSSSDSTSSTNTSSSDTDTSTSSTGAGSPTAPATEVPATEVPADDNMAGMDM